ncbi:hypothetical protein J2X16_001815 [Pelomonas aquatica]|uniref:Uncharacterized protein n=1 Tax=Pelomonas aquatica TaxID=431058 RepID=A0ABU1Z8U2_9BURK|nr:hypothetical protein [Pelomonas aquatica]MDR7296476.1 hypothetical protein [Pelomonas aquatica]
MSDNYLQYVPADPKFRPSAEAAVQAENLLARLLPDAEVVRASFYESVMFFDPGANWSGVNCPKCGADAEPWFGDATSQAADAAFESLFTTTPCCGNVVSLNELSFVWPAAFGSFMLEAANPNSRGLAPAELSQLEAALGCAVREVAMHL